MSKTSLVGGRVCWGLWWFRLTGMGGLVGVPGVVGDDGGVGGGVGGGDLVSDVDCVRLDSGGGGGGDVLAMRGLDGVFFKWW